MHLPTLRQLQFLVAIADQGSFSKAAEKSNVTQPTLSAAIKELEALLDVQLIEREARGASLTHAGEVAVARARSVINEAHDLVDAAREAQQPLTSGFRLGAIPTLAPYILPAALPLLKERFPRLKLYLREDLTDRLLESLKNRTLDAALIALPWEASGIETMILCDDEFLLASPADHSLSSKAFLQPRDLLDEDVLLLEDGHCLRTHAQSVCGLSLQNQSMEVSATSLQTLVQMVAGGLGVSLIPKIAADGGVAAGTNVSLRSFKEPVVGRSIGIAWRKNSPRAEEAQLVGLAAKDAIGL